jgi:outer membrane lipase/esterase
MGKAAGVRRGLAYIVLAAFLMAEGALASPAREAARAAEFQRLVVFGDSLSDTGNAGRFSNGPVWVEVIADRIGADLKPSRSGGTNYAVGGARSHGRANDLRGQLETYFASPHRRSISETLFVVFGGANDLLAAGCAAGERAATTAAAAIAATVSDLAAAGARRILVPNLPDIGAAPLVRAQGAACADRARLLSRTFNTALEQKLDAVERRYRAHIVRLDAFALSEELMANPGEAGFDDIDTPCAGGPCARALFWDPLHPTARAHARLAAAALQALDMPETD